MAIKSQVWLICIHCSHLSVMILASKSIRDKHWLPARSCWNENWMSTCLMSLCLSQPLGSFSHVCPHRAGRLSGWSQLHLGDAEAGLQEDAFPRESVRPVQPQLVPQNEVTFCPPFPDVNSHADGDWADLVVWLEERGEKSIYIIIKPRIKVLIRIILTEQ